MNKKIMVLTFSSLLVAIAISSVGLVNAAGPKLVLDMSHGVGDKYVNYVAGNLTQWGYTVVQAKGGLNSSVLSDAQFLFVGQIGSSTQNFTNAEINAVKAWFDTGGKTIWVAADSDFPPGAYRIDQANKMLAAIGSKLRLEQTAVQDPQSSAASAYRVVTNVTNTALSVSNITSGVSKLLFHGPTLVYAMKDGRPVALENMTVDNVYWVLKTSAAGTIVDSDNVPPAAHTNGQQDSFVMLAVEKFAGLSESSKVIATGETPYGGYQPIFSWAYYTATSLQGSTLLKNLVKWGITVEQPTWYTSQTYGPAITNLQNTVNSLSSDVKALKDSVATLTTIAYVGIIVGIIGVAVAVYAIMRKPK